MKCFYDIKLKTSKNENTGLVGYTNIQTFVLKTTGFNIITDTDWINLGGFSSKVALRDTLSGLSIHLDMPITTEFDSKIQVDFTAKKANIGTFSTLADFDNLRLSELDDNSIGSMDGKIISEEG